MTDRTFTGLRHHTALASVLMIPAALPAFAAHAVMDFLDTL